MTVISPVEMGFIVKSKKFQIGYQSAGDLGSLKAIWARCLKKSKNKLFDYYRIGYRDNKLVDNYIEGQVIELDSPVRPKSINMSKPGNWIFIDFS